VTPDERTRLGPALVAHTTLSVALLYVPLLVAVGTSAPTEPLFAGPAGLLAPAYYLGVLGVILAPSLQSFRESTHPEPSVDASPADGAVGDLQRRYVEGEISEAELERDLERLLEE